MATNTTTPAESKIVKNFKTGLVEILVRNNRYVVKAEQGNLTLNVPGPTVEVYPDRGRLYDPDDPEDEPLIQYGADQPMTGTWSAYLRDPGSEDYITLSDIVMQTGLFFSRWGTELRNAGPDSPKVATIQWWLRGQRVGDLRNKGYRCRFCHITGSVAEGSPNLITCNFTSYSPKPEPARWER
jgi:hypothetical protein